MVFFNLRRIAIHANCKISLPQAFIANLDFYFPRAVKSWQAQLDNAWIRAFVSDRIVEKNREREVNEECLCAANKLIQMLVTAQTILSYRSFSRPQ